MCRRPTGALRLPSSTQPGRAQGRSQPACGPRILLAARLGSEGPRTPGFVGSDKGSSLVSQTQRLPGDAARPRRGVISRAVEVAPQAAQAGVRGVRCRASGRGSGRAESVQSSQDRSPSAPGRAPRSLTQRPAHCCCNRTVGSDGRFNRNPFQRPQKNASLQHQKHGLRKE